MTASLYWHYMDIERWVQ